MNVTSIIDLKYNFVLNNISHGNVTNYSLKPLTNSIFTVLKKLNRI